MSRDKCPSMHVFRVKQRLACLLSFKYYSPVLTEEYKSRDAFRPIARERNDLMDGPIKLSVYELLARVVCLFRLVIVRDAKEIRENKIAARKLMCKKNVSRPHDFPRLFSSWVFFPRHARRTKQKRHY